MARSTPVRPSERANRVAAARKRTGTSEIAAQVAEIVSTNCKKFHRKSAACVLEGLNR